MALTANAFAADTGPRVLTVCQVLDQCTNGHGKTIRIKGVYAASDHSRTIYDVNCGYSYEEGKRETPPVVEIYSVLGESKSDRVAMSEIDQFAAAHRSELLNERISLTVEGQLACQNKLHYRNDENGKLAADGFGPSGIWKARIMLKRVLKITVIGIQ